MLTRVRGHVRGNAVAYVALFFALGGGVAWAVETNSVKSRHIAPDAVKGADVKPDSLKGVQIKEASLDVPGAVGGVVNPDGSTQQLTPGVAVTHPSSGRYSISIPYALMSDWPVPVVTIISPDSHRVEGQSVQQGDGQWVIDLQLTGGDHCSTSS